jgi:hypothetical protein
MLADTRTGKEGRLTLVDGAEILRHNPREALDRRWKWLANAHPDDNLGTKARLPFLENYMTNIRTAAFRGG